MIWQAVDSLGNVSAPFISKENMNKEIYLDKCIKKY